MTWWVRGDIQHVSRGNWRAFVPGPEIFVEGSSEADVKAQVEAAIEQGTGTKDFKVIYREA